MSNNINEILEGIKVFEEMARSGVCNADDLESVIDFEMKHLDNGEERNAYLYGVLTVLADLYKGTLTRIKYENQVVNRLRKLEAGGQ